MKALGLELDLPAAQVSELFPFSFVLDRGLRIVGAGASLARLRPELLGRLLHDEFELRRPARLSFEAVAAGQAPQVMLAARGSELVLRGQFRHHAQADKLFFVGSPWLTEVRSLKALGLKVSDFAAHDPVMDMLQLIQAHAAAAAEAKSVGEQLEQSHHELERTLRWLSLQYGVSDALGDAGGQDVSVRILSLLCQATEWQVAVIWLDDGTALRPEATWREHDLLDLNALEIPHSIERGEGLVGKVWATAMPTTSADDPDRTEQLRFACPIIGGDGRTLGVLEMSKPRSEPASATGLAISEAAIKLGLYLERERTQKELIAAKEQAEAGTRTKSEFLANISHELRTPLNGMLGMAQLLSCMPLPHTAAGYVETLLASSNTLLTIINDLLDLAKIEAGKLDLEITDCDVLAVVDDVLEHFRPGAQAKGVELTIEAQGPTGAHCDPRRLRQVLLNLVGNALKFTEQGSVRIWVGIDPERPSALRCEVRDSGVGIPAARVSQLFVPFEQADLGVARKYGGTGLGLAICKRLLGMMHGEIGVQSQEGAGSVFWFRLPQALVQPTSERRPRPLRARISARPAHGPFAHDTPTTPARGSVLLVEDNSVNQMVAAAMLKQLGYDVDVASGGRECLAQLARRQYSAVLMDCQMPDLDGFETARMIRSSKSVLRPDIPVIALTAAARPEDRKQCIDASMNDFLSKPIERSALAETLERWILVG